MPKIVDRNIFLTAAAETYGDIETITREQVLHICETNGYGYPVWLTNDPARRVSRGVYSLVPNPKDAPKTTPVFKLEDQPAPAHDDTSEVAVAALVAANPELTLIPTKAQGYVPFGHFNDIRSIIKSKKFFPTYITGLSGNGKTLMVDQICASEGRELVRVNITRETDEDDLIGGFRLVEGHTVWQNGPVIIAMERGAVLLLDEVDLGDAKLMCLQPVLEGKAIYLKKINKVVKPAPGFTIVATANTKGKGSEDGRFIGTNVMNEAFLERFSITFEQEYPPVATETKIIQNIFSANGIEDAEFVKELVTWAEVIRKAFYDDALSDIISTRRLVHIAEAYIIFRNRKKAIELCLNRFDVDTKLSFLELYEKIGEHALAPAASGETNTENDLEIAF